MIARIVVVHDDPEFLTDLNQALAEYDVATFDHPDAVLEALKATNGVDVLVTRVAFTDTQPVGLSLARVARAVCPGVKVIFTARPEYRAYVEGDGVFLASPLPSALLASTARLALG